MNIKGLVEVKVRDKDTGELKRTYNFENIMTEGGEERALQGVGLPDSGYGPESFTPPGNVSYTKRENIYIADTPLIGGIRTLRHVSGNFIQGTPISSTWFDSTTSTPAFLELLNSFDPPTSSTRNIYVIYIGRSSDGGPESNMEAYVSLATPCTQSTTEVLQVFYRLQFVDTPVVSPAPGLRVFDKANYYMARNFTQGELWPSKPDGSTSQENYSGFPYLEAKHWQTVDIDTSQWKNLAPRFNENLMTAEMSTPRGYFRKRYNFSQTLSDNIGKIFGIFITGTRSFASATFPATPANFANKPIQTIHNHNSNAAAPFLDVDFLATGQGTITADGSGWIEPTYPEFYRIEMYNTGDVGTSTYSFRRRMISGFSGNTYDEATQPLPWLNTGPFETVKNGHGTKNNYRHIEEYDSNTVIIWDDTGISVINVATSNVVSFDGTGSPALLPVTSVFQVAADDNGNIYVACSNTGLYKITDPFGTPIVKHFTVATDGVPSDTKCYGVAQGYNNSIWAIFEGGLSQTLNGGTTWTNYNTTSTPAFNYTGITDNNWSQVRMLRIDRDSPDNELGILYVNPADTATFKAYLAWWSTKGISFAGSNFTNMLVTDSGKARYFNFKCSRRGSFWGLISSTDIWKLTFGTSTTTGLKITGTSTGQSDTHGVTFFYDRYDNPYFLGGGQYQSTLASYSAALWHKDNYYVGETGTLITRTSPTSAKTPVFSFESTGDGKSSILIYGYDSPNFYFSLQNLNPHYTFNNDPLNGKYTPFSEMLWDDYRWNGSAWVKDYQAPALATDATGTLTPALDAIRYNFDVESHYFTGRSCVDVSVSASTNYTNILTFAATIHPDAKLLGQHPQQTLFDALEISQIGSPAIASNLQLVWRNTDTTPNVSLFDGTTEYTFGATPADDGTEHRIVFIVNGTSASCYLDGAQLGSTATINQIDLSNTSGNLNFTLGGRALNHPNGPDRFFRGNMNNVQLWNVAWNATNVTNDNANRTGADGGNAVDLKARYEFTQAISETKPTHSAPGSPPGAGEALLNGININFINGASAPAFTSTDYYTFGVCDGILKDNAISFSYDYNMYYKPVSLGFSDIEDTVNDPGNVNNSIPKVPNAPGNVTELITFRNANTTSYVYTMPGQLSSKTTTIGWTQVGGTSFQYISGDGYIEWQITAPDDDYVMGLINVPGDPLNRDNIDYGFKINPNSYFDVFENGNFLPNGMFVIGDTFKIERTGTTVKYYHNTTLIYTSIIASSGNLWARITIDKTSGVYNAKINYTRPAYILDLGNSQLLTGKYDADFSTADPLEASFVIGGVPATVITENTTDRLETVTTLPSQGEVIFIPDAGLAVFNSADATKQVTASYNLVKFK